MPELPDVEIFRQYFNDTAKGKKITGVQINAPGMLEDVSPGQLRSELTGKTVFSAERHGKYLFGGLDSGAWLVLHFGMTGFLRYFDAPDGDTPYDKLKLTFEGDGCLVFDCRRKLGEIGLVGDRDAFIRKKHLGADPLAQDFGISDFISVMSGKKGAIKSALMNQATLAGIGNIYSDEILFQAGIDPASKMGDLTRADLEAVYHAMLDVLHTAIASNADAERLPQGYLLPQRKKGGTCPKCGSTLVKRKFSGRGAFACPSCQKMR